MMSSLVARAHFGPPEGLLGEPLRQPLQKPCSAHADHHTGTRVSSRLERHWFALAKERVLEFFLGWMVIGGLVTHSSVGHRLDNQL